MIYETNISPLVCLSESWCYINMLQEAKTICELVPVVLLYIPYFFFMKLGK